MAYRVFVDDNFHYMDEDERYELGSFVTLAAALEAARQIVDYYLTSNYRPGVTPGDLFESYKSFGEDPFIIAEGDEKISFSAWDYAKQRCDELCKMIVKR